MFVSCHSPVVFNWASLKCRRYSRSPPGGLITCLSDICFADMLQGYLSIPFWLTGLGSMEKFSLLMKIFVRCAVYCSLVLQVWTVSLWTVLHWCYVPQFQNDVCLLYWYPYLQQMSPSFVNIFQTCWLSHTFTAESKANVYVSKYEDISLTWCILQVFHSCSALRPYITHIDDIYKDFTTYKTSVPVTGAIILDESYERVCLFVFSPFLCPVFVSNSGMS